MEKLSKDNKNLYAQFYYVIVCPNFGPELSAELVKRK